MHPVASSTTGPVARPVLRRPNLTLDQAEIPDITDLTDTGATEHGAHTPDPNGPFRSPCQTTLTSASQLVPRLDIGDGSMHSQTAVTWTASISTHQTKREPSAQWIEGPNGTWVRHARHSRTGPLHGEHCIV